MRKQICLSWSFYLEQVKIVIKMSSLVNLGITDYGHRDCEYGLRRSVPRRIEPIDKDTGCDSCRSAGVFINGAYLVSFWEENRWTSFLISLSIPWVNWAVIPRASCTWGDSFAVPVLVHGGEVSGEDLAEAHPVAATRHRQDHELRHHQNHHGFVHRRNIC